MITAQMIYDLRELTGFASGVDLHDLFRAICDGEPSPSGKVEIHPLALASHPVGLKAMKEASSDTQIARHIDQYCGAGVAEFFARQPSGAKIELTADALRRTMEFYENL